jgi:hypothetical protein
MQTIADSTNPFVANVYTTLHQAGCGGDVVVNPQLRLVAEWHTNDVMNNRALNGDIGSDGTTVKDRAAMAGHTGEVAETVAINPALAISGIELINQWYAPCRRCLWQPAIGPHD